jgi:hypothetical protein
MAVDRPRTRLVVRLMAMSGAVLLTLVIVGMMSMRDVGDVDGGAPPGSALRSGEYCADTIERSGWEPVPENTEANHTTPTSTEIPPRSEYQPEANTEVFGRIDGQFVGTTDEILEWGACKWGFDSDLVRAQAFVESSWVQAATGDVSNNPDWCVPGDEPPCPTSFGLMQIKHLFHPGSYPDSVTSTAYNVDYALALMRACYEGLLKRLPDDYAAGDLRGCLGHYFAGEWDVRIGHTYAVRVLRAYADERWRDLES